MEFRYGKPEEVGMSSDRIKHVENTMERWVKEGVSPAIVMLAARKGVIVSHKAFGVTGPEEGAAPVELNTLYPLASMTKPISATCIMILMERGLLDLNRPVQDYIPEFTGEGKEKVMIHHLLSHTSGLTREDTNSNIWDKKQRNVPVPPIESTSYPTVHNYLWWGYDTPLRNPPGKVMSYCSFGYEMAGEIVRRLSGQSLEDFARENIFNPIGMNDTYYVVPDQMFSRVVRRKPGKKDSVDRFSTPDAMRSPFARGGAYSTVLDMAKFGQMYLNKGIFGNKQILSPVTVSEMTRNQIPGVSATYGDEEFEEACWGYGWNVRGHKKDTCGTLRSATSINHGGNGGVSLWVDPVYETVAVYFSVDAKQNIDLYNNMVLASIVEE